MTARSWEGTKRTTAGGLAPVTCWCERGIVHVPWSDIRAGRTASCDRNRCQPERQPT